MTALPAHDGHHCKLRFNYQNALQLELRVSLIK